MSKKKILLVGACVLTLAVSNAAEYFVDASRPDDSGDGLSEATAKQTIQAAVALARGGDVVTVLPGVYDKGYGTYTCKIKDVTYTLTNRVSITRAITLRSRDGAAVTHIVGARDEAAYAADPATLGVGHGAIRCIQATEAGTVISGFTIRGGCCHELAATDGDNEANKAGGVSGSSTTYVVDSVVRDCVGARGGAFRRCRVVRCRVFGNASQAGSSAVGRDTVFVNSLIYNNRQTAASGSLLYGGGVYNCTIVDNDKLPIVGTENGEKYRVRVYNSLIVGNDDAPIRNTAWADVKNSLLDQSRFATPANATFKDCVLTPTGYDFFAPLKGDFRLVSGAQAEEVGDSSLLEGMDYPPAVDVFKDIDGTPIPRNAKIIAGCCQTAVEATSGVFLFTPDSCVMSEVGGDYVPLTTRNLYFRTASVPQILHVAPVKGDKHLLYMGDPATLGVGYEPPLMDDTFHVAVPPVGCLTSNKVYLVSAAAYVGPGGTDAEGFGESADRPFATIQYAVDRSTASRVIYVAKGDYLTGELEQSSKSGKSRVVVRNTNALRIKGAGRGESVIWGKLDSTSGEADGRGDNAVRGVYIVSRALVQGFTIKDGATKQSTDDRPYANGGGAYCDESAATLADCAFDHCIGFRGGVVCNGRYVRCAFVNSPVSSGGATRFADFYSCVFHDNRTWVDGSTPGPLIGNTCGGTFNTVAASADGLDFPMDGSSFVTNSVLVDLAATKTTKSVAMPATFVANVFWNLNFKSRAGRDYREADPLLVDASNADFRLMACAPGLGFGTAELDYSRCSVSDFDGRPILIVGGRPTVGAVHSTVATVICEKPAYGTVTPALTNLVEAGESVTITVQGDGTRPFSGCQVDGEFVGGSPFVYTYTAPAADRGPATAPVCIEPQFLPHWYVDASRPDDTGDGFTPATAKKRIETVISNQYLMSGDTIHVAPGVYDTGAFDQPVEFVKDKNKKAKARVSVAPGIVLKADEGPEKTFIVGAGTAGDAHGLGDDSIRCAFVQGGGKLEGFTLTGGHTASGSDEYDGFCGGGVLAKNYSSGAPYALIENCVISNNFARRGGGGYGGFYRNCRIVDNYAMGNPPAVGRTCLSGCFVDGNYGSKETMRFIYGLDHCTIGPNNSSDEQGTPTVRVINDWSNLGSSTGMISSTLFLGKWEDVSGKIYPVCTNSLFLADAVGSSCKSKWTVDVREATLSEISLSNDGRLGRASVAIDAADPNLLSAELLTDAFGGQRVYNGLPDIGAAEFDWRGVYAATLGGGVTVTQADPKVKLGAGETVRIAEGTLAVRWPNETSRPRSKRSFGVECLSAGNLTVSLNGTTLAELKPEDGRRTLTFNSGDEPDELLFAYAGDADGTGCAVLDSFDDGNRGMVIIIR